jgi:ATP-binding cassette subfamily F protein uup
LLEEALVAFGGSVIVVSHDRYFLNRVCTAILAFEDEGVLRYSVGNYDYYLEKRAEEPAAAIASAESSAKSSAAAKPAARGRKLKWKEERELEGMEAAILAAEDEAARIETQLADPEFFKKNAADFPKIEAELRKARDQIARLYARWQELEGIAKAAGIEKVSA